MEARFGGASDVYGPRMTDLKRVGKRTLEWDLNDWKWDGDLFQATPLNPILSGRELFPLTPEVAANGTNADGSNSSSFCSEETIPNNEVEKREVDKRRRNVVVPDDEELNNEAGPLNLKLGEQEYLIVEGEADKCEGKGGKKSKLVGTSQPVCQVEGCGAGLNNAKDYHRRHKVCEMHSKATEALVGNMMQRFCQQCSRFHALQEFDEGKRSCRRRLAGHNKRRRKTHPETSANGGSLTDEGNAGQLLISLLRVLSNMYTNGSEQSKDQDLLSQLLKTLAGASNGSTLSGMIQGSQGLPGVGTSNGISGKELSRIQEPYHALPSTDAQRGLSTRDNQYELQKRASASQPNASLPTGGTNPAQISVQEAPVGRQMLVDIDLNNVYNEFEECVGDLEKGNGSAVCTYWAEQDLPSPPQTSGNSASSSGRSSSSGSEAQCRTDRIVFKLFGKDPNDLPHVLRTQILDWLSLSPTDIEGYIRPGCIVLTVYLRLNDSLWEEFCYDMSSSLSRLLDASNDPFWKTGWIYTRIQQRAAFISDGRVVLDTPFPPRSHGSQISSISPIAVPSAETVQLVVRGSNLFGPTSRLLCAIEGSYLVQESCYNLVEGTQNADEQDEFQSLSFSCSIPNVIGRGFIEVEDYVVSGSFFPFIVAEPEICSEICMLESVIQVLGTDEGIDGNSDEIDARDCALDFIHEMGWLLHKYCMRSKPGRSEPSLDLFPFERLKWLVEFSVDHDWCAVLRKLLDFLLSGTVDLGVHASIDHALSDMALLHAAVQRNSRPMVEFLLRFVPRKVDSSLVVEHKQPDYGPPSSLLFRPDVVGAGGLTPLHIAASSAGSENVLDALLEDPGMVGIEAWKNARDSTGLTPYDYACLRSHHRYINLAQKKINQKSSGKHVVLDIPSFTSLESYQKQTDKLKSAEFSSFYTEKSQVSTSCRLCEQKPYYGSRRAALTSRSFVFTMVSVAVVCVCTALLFKSGPNVGFCKSFRWETLKFGAI